MNQLWQTFGFLDRVLLLSAAVGGVMFCVRLAMLSMGGHHGLTDGDSFDAHHSDSDAGFKFLSFQGLSSFLLMGGLVGLALHRQMHLGTPGVLLGGVAAGLVTLFLLARIFAGMHRLEQDGTTNLLNAIGGEATVYSRIPPNGIGQIQVVVQGALRTIDATQSGAEPLETGAKVLVVHLEKPSTLVVRPYEGVTT
ncbi:MAG: hypothetical protein U1F87_07590 [Kiritimatiellia bacterium]